MWNKCGLSDTVYIQDDDSKGGDGGDSKGGDGDGDGGSGDGEGGDGESGDASEIMFMEQTTEKTSVTLYLY